MPSPSSPVPRLSSVPSDVFTVHTIASRSTYRHRRTSNQSEMKGSHPVLFWAMLSPPPHNRSTSSKQTAGQSLDGLQSCPHRPLPRPSPPSGDKGKAEQKSKKKGRKRENQGEGCRRPLRPFLASPSAPSDVFTVHTIASRSPPRPLVPALRERDGRPPRPLLGDAIATTSPHLAADLPTTSSRAAPRRSSIMPASSSTPSLSSVCCHHRPHHRPFFPSVFVCGSCYSSP